MRPLDHLRLETSLVPLRVDRSSYELTRRYLHDGELPPPKTVHTEDFLAALDYGYPRPQGEVLGVSAAGGPSPFAAESLRLEHGGAESLRMLHIGLQAQDQPRIPRPPAHLVVALDTSASMAWGGRLDLACRAWATSSSNSSRTTGCGWSRSATRPS